MTLLFCCHEIHEDQWNCHVMCVIAESPNTIPVNGSPLHHWGIVGPDCKVCCVWSSPCTFVYVRTKYITYILSAQYLARNCICRIEEHSKCKMVMCFRCKRQHVQPNECTLNIFISKTHIQRTFAIRKQLLGYLSLAVHKVCSCRHWSTFHLHISGSFICLPSALCKLCIRD